MIGAIAGDIIGSVYEWDNIKTKKFVLFLKGVFSPTTQYSPWPWPTVSSQARPMPRKGQE